MSKTSISILAILLVGALILMGVSAGYDIGRSRGVGQYYETVYQRCLNGEVLFREKDGLAYICVKGEQDVY